MPRTQVVDPKRASYGVENLLFAVVQLAQSAMRKCVHTVPRTNCLLACPQPNAGAPPLRRSVVR